MKVFFLYTIVFIIFFSSSLYLKIFYPNVLIIVLLLRFFLIFEFGLLGIYYSYNVKSPKKNTILLCSFLLYTTITFGDYFAFEDKLSYYVPLSIECLFFIVIIILFFYEKMRFISSTPLYKLSSFWISVGFQTYFSGSFLLFLASIFWIRDPGFQKQYQIIYTIVAVIKNILLVIGIWINKKHGNETRDSSFQPSVDLETFIPFNK